MCWMVHLLGTVIGCSPLECTICIWYVCLCKICETVPHCNYLWLDASIKSRASQPVSMVKTKDVCNLAELTRYQPVPTDSEIDLSVRESLIKNRIFPALDIEVYLTFYFYLRTMNWTFIRRERIDLCSHFSAHKQEFCSASWGKVYAWFLPGILVR